MFEQVKILLTDEYKSELMRFEELKNQIEQIELEMNEDHSEEKYLQDLKELNKRYGLFRNSKKAYKIDLLELQTNYHKKLQEFQKKYDEYQELKRQASLINIYGIQKKLDQLKVASSLEDIKMTEEEATAFIDKKANMMG